MKVVHINISDAMEGASGAVRTLISEQQTQGIEPELFAFHHLTRDAYVHALPRSEEDPWRQSMSRLEKREGFIGLSASALLELWRDPVFEQADLVHLHATMPDYFSCLLLPSLAAKPLVWSLYDSFPYTAGCYSTAICERWRRQECQGCPQAPERQARQEELYRLKKALYELTPMAVVTPNSWMTGQVKDSMLAARFAAEIPPAVAPEFFRRFDQQAVRRQLQIEADAFVMAFASPSGLDNPAFGGPFVRQALEQWKPEKQKTALLQFGGQESERSLPEFFIRKIVPYGLPRDQKSALLQAADVFLQLSPYDAIAMHGLEAAAAGVPSVAFPCAAASAYVRHLEDGYLSSYNDIGGIVRGLQFLSEKPKLVRQMGDRAARRIWERHQAKITAVAYREVYDQLIAKGGRNWAIPIVPIEVPSMQKSGVELNMLLELTGIESTVGNAITQGSLEVLWQKLNDAWSGFPKEREWERGVFVDLFLTEIVLKMKQPMAPMLLVEVLAHWMRLRQLPQRCGNFSPTEKMALQRWTKVIRRALELFLRATPVEYFAQLSSLQQGCLINFWRILFFNDFTTPYLEEEYHREERLKVEATTGVQRIYPDLLLRSMYSPYPPENVRLDMVRLLKKDVPIALQVILAFWLVNVPYFDGDEKRQRIMRRNATAFLRDAMQDPETLPQPFYAGVVEIFIPQFWRAAYLGDNLVKEISLFGDFLHQQMRRFYPSMTEKIQPRPQENNRRLRIGYISSNFFRQAVSFYMANRIFFADRQKFEIQIFSLQKKHDNLTDRIKGHSDRFIAFANFGDLGGMADTIKKSELDILIYADIGMDQITYQLAAMRLAPVQCVLVGHGVTSGLPTIDYYLSGDFESPKAQEHYREKLVRLPNLGAAQLPPPLPPTGKWTRRHYELPEDAVILVSCANGIKHGGARDALLVRILQQAPNAVIVLKPFMDPSLVQPKWIQRVQAAAKQGGVSDRLRVLPPLPLGNDLMDFLSLADIQLDTYPYGGWTTNMEAVYAGLAIVTQEGEQARSRWGSHILRALGIKAGIARNENEYVKQAVELVKNTELREKVRRQIKERAMEVLFNGAAAQPAYESMLMQIRKESLTRWEQEGRK